MSYGVKGTGYRWKLPAVATKVQSEETKLPRTENNTAKTNVSKVADRAMHKGDSPYKTSISINKRLASDIKPVDFFKILENEIDSFNDVNCATCWYRLAKNKDEKKWKISFDDPSLVKIKELTSKFLSKLNDSNLGEVVLAFAELGCKSTDYINPLKRIISDRLNGHNDFSGQDITNILKAFATFGCQDTEFVDALKEDVMFKLKAKCFDDVKKVRQIKSDFERLGCNDKEFIESLSCAEGIDHPHGQSKNNANPDFIKDPIKINIELTKSTYEITHYFHILKECFEYFDKQNTVTFWDRLAKNKDEKKWKISFDDPRLNKISNYTYSILGQYDDRSLANIAFSLSKLGCRDRDFIGAIQKEIKERLKKQHSFDGHGLSSIALAFGKFDFFHTDFIDILKKAILKGLKDPDFYVGYGLANIAWAFAKFRCKDKEFITALKGGIVKKLLKENFFNGQNFSNIAWAFVNLDPKDTAFSSSLKWAIKPNLEVDGFFNGQGLSNIIWSFAKYDYRDLDFIHNLKNAIDPKLQIDGFFTGQGFSTIIWALAKLEYRDYEFINKFASIIESKLKIPNFFDGQGLSNMLWAFTQLGCVAPEFIELITSVIKDQLENFDFFCGQELASIAVSFVKLGCKDQEFIDLLKQVVENNLKRPNFFNGQGLSNLSWALANFGCSDEKFINALKEVIEAKLKIPRYFNCAEIVSIAWSFATFEYTKDVNFNEGLRLSAISHIDDFRYLEAYGITNLVWAFATFGCTDKKLITAFKAAIKSKLTTPGFFNTEEQISVSYSFSKLKCNDDDFFQELKKAFAVPAKEVSPSCLEEVVSSFSALKVSGNETKEPKTGDDKLTIGANGTDAQYQMICNNQKMSSKDFFRFLDGFSFNTTSASVFWNYLARQENGISKVSFDDVRLSKLKKYTFENLDKFNGHDLAITAWALSVLSCRDMEFITALKLAVERKLNSGDFNGKGFCDLTLAFINFKDKEFLTSIEKAIHSTVLVSEKAIRLKGYRKGTKITRGILTFSKLKK